MADDSSVDDSGDGPPWWRGGFGLGGFFGNPSLTAPATGAPPGTSLMTPTNAAGMGPHIDPTTGQPEMLTGPGSITDRNVSKFNNPMSWLTMGANLYPPARIPALAAAEITRATPTANDAAPTNAWFQRPSGVGGMPGPQVTNPPQPDHPSTMRYPMWPTPPAPTGIDATIPPFTARPVTPTPATAYPASPVATSAAAGPAAVRQQPNLGAYGAGGPFTTLDYRPNSGPNERNRGSPVATALDLSRLFGGGQPAAAAPRAVGGGAPTAANPNNPYWGPNTAGRAVGGGPIMPTDITGYPVAGVNVPAAARGFTVNPDLSTRRPRSRSSSSSQGGGY